MMKRDTKYWARMERRIEKNDYLQSLQGGSGLGDFSDTFFSYGTQISFLFLKKFNILLLFF